MNFLEPHPSSRARYLTRAGALIRPLVVFRPLSIEFEKHQVEPGQVAHFPATWPTNEGFGYVRPDWLAYAAHARHFRILGMAINDRPQLFLDDGVPPTDSIFNSLGSGCETCAFGTPIVLTVRNDAKKRLPWHGALVMAGHVTDDTINEILDGCDLSAIARPHARALLKLGCHYGAGGGWPRRDDRKAQVCSALQEAGFLMPGSKPGRTWLTLKGAVVSAALAWGDDLIRKPEPAAPATPALTPCMCGARGRAPVCRVCGGGPAPRRKRGGERLTAARNASHP